MSKGILIISFLVAMMFILGPQNGYSIAVNVLNITNSNTTDVNGAGGRAAVPDTKTGPLPEGNETGNIVSLPGKCLGSALCPD